MIALFVMKIEYSPCGSVIHRSVPLSIRSRNVLGSVSPSTPSSTEFIEFPQNLPSFTGFYRVFTGLEWVLLLNEVLNCYLWIQTFNPVKTFGRDGGGHFVFNPEIPRKPNSMKINSSNRFWFSIESKTRSNRGVFVKDFWYQCTQCECRDEMKTLFSPGNPRKPHETKIHLSNGSKFPMAKKNSRKPTETWQRSFNSLIRRFQVSSVYFIDSFNLLTDGPL